MNVLYVNGRENNERKVRTEARNERGNNERKVRTEPPVEKKEQKRRKMAGEKHNSDYYIKWILINRLLNTVRQAKGLPLVKCPYKEEREAMTEANAVSEEKTEKEEEE